MDEKKQHSFSVTERKIVCVNAVSEVDCMTNDKITLTLLTGEKMWITGSGLKISVFSKESGTLGVTGKIACVKYADEKISLIKRLTK